MSASANPTDTIATPAEPARKSRRWVRWAVPIGTFVLGVTLGFAGGSADPKESQEYQAIEKQLAAAHDDVDAAEGKGSAS